MTEHGMMTMDHGVLRLERMYVTARYLQVWWEFEDEEEKKLHLSRLTQELGNARQVAEYWREFAERNGIKLPDDDSS